MKHASRRPLSWLIFDVGQKMHRSFLTVLMLIVAGCQSPSRAPGSAFFDDPKIVTLCDAVRAGDVGSLTAASRVVDLNATGRAGMTPLIWSMLNQYQTGFAFLLKHGANPNAQLSESIDDIATKGNSAMSFAAMHRDAWYLSQVLQHGGDCNLVNSTRSNTPIIASIMAMRSENTRTLIAAGADLNWKSRRGLTPLRYAAMTGQYDLVSAMLDAGANPALSDGNGYTILWEINKTSSGRSGSQGEWRRRVIERLKVNGIDVENGR